VCACVCVEGAFENGERHGHGTFASADGEFVFIGEYERDVIHGFGRLRCGEDRYEGEWAADLQNGFGTYTYGNGDKYVGNFVNGKMNGQGSLVTKGGTYDGLFLDGIKHGRGVFTMSNGDVYSGEWEDDKRNGRGVLQTQEHRYEGSFLHDRMHGQGLLTAADGSVLLEGEWVRGEHCCLGGKDQDTLGGSESLPGGEAVRNENITMEKGRSGNNEGAVNVAVKHEKGFDDNCDTEDTANKGVDCDDSDTNTSVEKDINEDDCNKAGVFIVDSEGTSNETENTARSFASVMADHGELDSTSANEEPTICKDEPAKCNEDNADADNDCGDRREKDFCESNSNSASSVIIDSIRLRIARSPSKGHVVSNDD
jgi:hypothetical protein